MDPSKSASAPPPGWTDEKSSVGQAAPPPYQDNPHLGYPQAGQGYPPQQQGYGTPPQYGGAYGQQPYAMGQQYPGQPATVTVQPAVYVTQGPLANPVNDYLGYSIFTMLCCCLPLGIAALIYSISAREANHLGDRMGAERSSRTARILNHVGLGLGIGVFILSVIYVAVVTSAREANYIGDRMGAERSSRMARILNHVALGLGIGVFIFFIICIVVAISF